MKDWICSWQRTCAKCCIDLYLSSVKIIFCLMSFKWNNNHSNWIQKQFSKSLSLKSLQERRDVMLVLSFHTCREFRPQSFSLVFAWCGDLSRKADGRRNISQQIWVLGKQVRAMLTNPFPQRLYNMTIFSFWRARGIAWAIEKAFSVHKIIVFMHVDFYTVCESVSLN